MGHRRPTGAMMTDICIELIVNYSFGYAVVLKSNYLNNLE